MLWFYRVRNKRDGSNEYCVEVRIPRNVAAFVCRTFSRRRYTFSCIGLGKFAETKLEAVASQMKDCLAFLFIRFLFSRRYFSFEVFKGVLHGQCMWVVLLGKVSFGNSTSRILFSPSGWAGSIGVGTFSGLIASNKRRSSEAFHFWTIKRGLVIKSTALMWVK